MFPHVSDVRVEILVERLEINVGGLGFRTARAMVPGNTPHLSSYQEATVIHAKR